METMRDEASRLHAVCRPPRKLGSLAIAPRPKETRRFPATRSGYASSPWCFPTRISAAARSRFPRTGDRLSCPCAGHSGSISRGGQPLAVPRAIFPGPRHMIRPHRRSGSSSCGRSFSPAAQDVSWFSRTLNVVLFVFAMNTCKHDTTPMTWEARPFARVIDFDLVPARGSIGVTGVRTRCVVLVPLGAHDHGSRRKHVRLWAAILHSEQCGIEIKRVCRGGTYRSVG
jgi:hypothetical protein